jgi:hypothetical protein
MVLAARLHYPPMPGYDSPAEQAVVVQEAALMLLFSAAGCSELARSAALQAVCRALPTLVQLLPTQVP